MEPAASLSPQKGRERPKVEAANVRREWQLALRAPAETSADAPALDPAKMANFQAFLQDPVFVRRHPTHAHRGQSEPATSDVAGTHSSSLPFGCRPSVLY